MAIFGLTKADLSDNLRYMTSSDFDRLLYETRKLLALYMYGHHTGGTPASDYCTIQVGAGAGMTFINVLTDTIYAPNSDTLDRGLNDGVDDAAAAAALSVSTTQSSVANFAYYRKTTTPLLPSGFATNRYAPVQFDDATTSIRPFEYAANSLLLELLDECINQMHSGDEIGSYRVGTTNPADDGYVEVISNFFTDTRYGEDDVVHKLYLKIDKTSTDTAPTSVEPFGLYFPTYPTGYPQAADLKLIDPTNGNDGLGSNTLTEYMIPHLVNRMIVGGMTRWYLHSSTPAGNEYVGRGTISDTHITGDDGGVVTFADPTYTKTVTPSGSVSTRSTLLFDWRFQNAY